MEKNPFTGKLCLSQNSQDDEIPGEAAPTQAKEPISHVKREHHLPVNAVINKDAILQLFSVQ
jgi:hypothetical protein